MHPAAKAFGIFHPAPIFIFGGQQQRHSAFDKNPVDAVRQPRPAPRIAIATFQRNKAGQRQVGDGALAGVALGT